MTSSDDLHAQWRDAVLETHDGVARPERAHNARVDRSRRLAEELAAQPGGRQLLERSAASDPSGHVRLSAATEIAVWNEPEARAVLESLVVAAGGRVARPMTMTAALATPHGPDGVGWTAALCLHNLDDGRRRSHPAPPAVAPAVTPDHLAVDAADQVLNLTLNGGVDHAYELVGDLFTVAATTFDAVGSPRAAALLRELLVLAEDSGQSSTTEQRAARLAGLDGAAADALDAVVAEFDALAPALVEQLDTASD